MCIYIYIYTQICVYIYIYIYMYRYTQFITAHYVVAVRASQIRSGATEPTSACATAASLEITYTQHNNSNNK